MGPLQPISHDHSPPPCHSGSRPGAFQLISRCVRRAFLCGDAAEHRRAWLNGVPGTLCSMVERRTAAAVIPFEKVTAIG